MQHQTQISSISFSGLPIVDSSATWDQQPQQRPMNGDMVNIMLDAFTWPQPISWYKIYAGLTWEL